MTLWENSFVFLSVTTWLPPLPPPPGWPHPYHSHPYHLHLDDSTSTIPTPTTSIQMTPTLTIPTHTIPSGYQVSRDQHEGPILRLWVFAWCKKSLLAQLLGRMRWLFLTQGQKAENKQERVSVLCFQVGFILWCKRKQRALMENASVLCCVFSLWLQQFLSNYFLQWRHEPTTLSSSLCPTKRTVTMHNHSENGGEEWVWKTGTEVGWHNHSGPSGSPKSHSLKFDSYKIGRAP